MPKGSSGIKRRGIISGKIIEKPKPSQDEIYASNVKQVENFVKKHPDLMPEGLLNYPGAAQYRVGMYEAVDRIYKRMPEGYIYSIRASSEGYGKNRHEVNFIALEHTYYTTETKVVGNKWEKVAVRHKSMIMGSDSYIAIPEDLRGSRSAIRGYAKAEVYRAAGRIYDSKTKGISKKYPALDSYGRPIG